MTTRVLLLLLLLAAASGLVVRADRQEAVPLRKSFAAFPLEMDGWRSAREAPLDDQIVAILGVDDYVTRVYRKAGTPGVGLYVGYWESQRQGDSIHSPQNCLPGAGWAPVSRRDLAISRPAASPGDDAVVNRYIIQKGVDRQLVLYWYQSHGRIIASEYWGKIALVTDAVRLNRSDAAVVRVMTPIVDGTAEAELMAEQTTSAFVRGLLPLLDEFLPR
jgi:EpsI family protein